MKLLLGEFDIQSNKILLELLITVEKSTKMIRSTIFLPENYPNTSLKTKILHMPLLEILISINKTSSILIDDNDTFNLSSYRDVLESIIPTMSKKYLFIHKFYMYPKSKNITMTIQEENVFRGLGKKCLILTIQKIFEEYKIMDTKDTFCFLESSGCILQEKSSTDLKTKYMNMDRSELLHL
jgi:hypothetical protein